MREILFKGKNPNGIWVYGYLESKFYIYSPEIRKEVLIDHKTVCQYTGLTDIMGRKIFEGDIVKHYYNEEEPERFQIGVIQWDEEFCGFCRTSGKPGCYMVTKSCAYEVVGNIFDNIDMGGTNYDRTENT